MSNNNLFVSTSVLIVLYLALYSITVGYLVYVFCFFPLRKKYKKFMDNIEEIEKKMSKTEFEDTKRCYNQDYVIAKLQDDLRNVSKLQDELRNIKTDVVILHRYSKQLEAIDTFTKHIETEVKDIKKYVDFKTEEIRKRQTKVTSIFLD